MAKKKARKRRGNSAPEPVQESAPSVRLSALLEAMERQGEGVAVAGLAEFHALKDDWEKLLPYLTRRLERSSRDEFVRLLPVLAALDDAELNQRLDDALIDKHLSFKALRTALSCWPAGATPSRERAEAWLQQAELLVQTTIEQARRSGEHDAERPAPTHLAQRFRGLPRTFRYGAYDDLVERADERLQATLLALAAADGELANDMAHWLLSADSERSARFAGLLLIVIPAKEKARVKAVRTAIHRLRGRGYTVDIPELDGEESSFRIEQPSMPPGLMTKIDVEGNRWLWLFVPHSITQMTSFYFVLSDVNGILHCDTFETSRKGAREGRRILCQESVASLRDVDVAAAYYLIEEAYAINQATGKPAPESYVLRRSQIEQARGEVNEPLIYAFLSRDDVCQNPWWLKGGDELARRLRVEFWCADERRLKVVDAKLQGLGESRIILPGHSGVERQMTFENEAAEEFFDASMRRFFQRRLEAVAYDLWMEEKFDDAKTALASSLAFEEEPFAADHNLFAKATLEVLFKRLEDERVGKDAEKLIVTPEEERRRFTAERVSAQQRRVMSRLDLS